MKLVMLRGLPGCGKSTIANNLAKKGYNLITIDKFKIKFLKKGKTPKEARQETYPIVLKKLELLMTQNKNIVIDDLFHDKNFLNKIKKFNYGLFPFYIKRNINDLLKIESSRKRKMIKNTKADFLYLKKKIEAIKIRKEIEILNKNIPLNKIIEIINNKVRNQNEDK